MEKKFELKDFMTAKQALEAIEYMNSLEQRIIDLEKEVENLNAACRRLNYLMTWHDVIGMTGGMV